MSKKDDVTELVKYDLNLNALSDEPVTAKEFVTKGLTLGELSELSQQDPSELTPQQREQVQKANEQLSEALKPILPQIKNAINASNGIFEEDYSGTIRPIPSEMAFPAKGSRTQTQTAYASRRTVLHYSCLSVRYSSKRQRAFQTC